MRLLLCDDDAIFLKLLEKYILEYFKKNKLPIPQIVSYENGSDLLSDPGECDFLFLDIEMPGPNGIYIGQKIKKKYPHVLLFIVTSYAEYLDDAMRIHVFRYLSKPIDKQRLFRNLKDGLRQYHMRSCKITIETKETVTQVPMTDIIMIERDGRNVYVYTIHNTYKSIRPMSYWLEQLQHPSFYQPHRSYIVNFQYVDHFDHTHIELQHGAFQAYIANRKYTQFRKAHLTYVESTR